MATEKSGSLEPPNHSVFIKVRSTGGDAASMYSSDAISLIQFQHRSQTPLVTFVSPHIVEGTSGIVD